MNKNGNEEEKGIFENEYYLIKQEIKTNISLINNMLYNVSSKDNIKTTKTEIKKALNKIVDLSGKIIEEKEIYESLLKKEENITRRLYSDLLHEKIIKEILEEKISSFMKIQADYELIKEKTGVIVCDGKIISDGRKDNEINILRTENSILKNVINEKEKEINELKKELEKCKKINNKILSPNYSQSDFTINNNFSCTTRNFYKTYKIQTKLLNKNTKTIENNNNSNINHKNSDITKKEKVISVNTNKFKNSKKLKTRNKCSDKLPFNNINNYSSCENILNRNKIEPKKIVRKSKIFYPMKEFNSVTYINTQSKENKENINNNINYNDIKHKNKLKFCYDKKEILSKSYYISFKKGIKSKI